ncbi:MAG: elongation factor Ts [Bacteroidales bacterium]|nr:elongation factor Ts [Bacteroidales bacterium]
MTQISASDVIKLRKTTGAGMMDCKKALQESGGDFEKAIEIIRKKGQAVANKRADREASEGVVLAKVSDDKTQGAMIVLNCETDFVAKNEDFVRFADKILNIALKEKPANLEELKQRNLDGTSIESSVVEQIGIIGEKIELAYLDNISAPMVISYIHPGNKLATLVGFNQGTSVEVAKDIAMQVAAMSPIAIDKDNVSEKIIEKEKEIGREQALREGKPENIVDRIAEGKVAKFLKENTLLNQEFTKDSKKTVRQYLQETDKNLKVVDFKRYSLSN